MTLTATGELSLKCPRITLDGQVRITGGLTVEGAGSGGAGVTTTGGLKNIGGVVTSNNVTLETHTHSGVQPGGGSTASPNGGT